MAWWGAGHAEPWFVHTDLASEGGDAQWYGLRGWCEQGFKVSKRGAWQWQQTQMTDPTRAARLWLALAVAMLWMTSVGSAQEDRGPTMAAALPDFRRLLGVAGTPPQRIRLVRLGWSWVLVQAIRQHPLPERLVPEPWPAIPKRISGVLWNQATVGYAWM